MSGSLRVMAGVFAAVLLPLTTGGLLVLVERPAVALRAAPAPGDWTEPLADATVAAGWHWRPVVTFLRPMGG